MMSGKRLFAACVLALFALCMQAACAFCQMRTYVYGGSEDDALLEMAVGGDGRVVMTGYTNSADGTLADRTRVGRSGWALCVDLDGHVLWSFVSRLGMHDSMAQPVFHEDGSVTVVLEAEPDDGMELEVIRLGRGGEVVSRKTMIRSSSEAPYVMLVGAHAQEGYVVRAANDKAETIGYSLYDYDGRLIKEYAPGEWQTDGIAMTASAGHVIRAKDHAGVLFARDAQGNETALCEVYALYPQEGVSGYLAGGRYNSLISLDDGGAAGCGWVLNGEKNGDPRPGRITRWDAQGGLVFDMWLEIGQLSGLVKIRDGYAAILCPEETGPRYEPLDYSLAYFDEAGICRGRAELPAAEECVMHAAPDGMLVILQRYYENGQGNVRMNVVEAL